MRYDIYGRDVFIANKMESNGKAGAVMVSETTRKILLREYNDEYDLQFHTNVEIK